MRARDNPFATARLERLPFEFPAGMTWEVLLERTAALNFRAAIVGPQGSGKTTLVHELVPKLVESGFVPLRVRLNEENKEVTNQFWTEFINELSPQSIVLWDGAEQLDARTWKRLLQASKSAAGLIITSHKPGLLPTLLECRTSPDLFRKLAGELVPPSALGGLPLNEIYARHQGNVRLGLLELYDFFAAMPA